MKFVQISNNINQMLFIPNVLSELHTLSIDSTDPIAQQCHLFNLRISSFFSMDNYSGLLYLYLVHPCIQFTTFSDMYVTE